MKLILFSIAIPLMCLGVTLGHAAGSSHINGIDLDSLSLPDQVRMAVDILQVADPAKDDMGKLLSAVQDSASHENSAVALAVIPEDIKQIAYVYMHDHNSDSGRRIKTMVAELQNPLADRVYGTFSKLQSYDEFIRDQCADTKDNENFVCVKLLQKRTELYTTAYGDLARLTLLNVAINYMLPHIGMESPNVNRIGEIAWNACDAKASIVR